MFLKINESSYICFDCGLLAMSEIEFVKDSFLINMNFISHITAKKCSIKTNISGKIVELQNKIEFDRFIDEGILNHFTLFFEDENNEEYQRINRCISSLIIDKKENKMSNHNADIKNANKGTNGINIAHAKNQGNRGKQMNPNQNITGESK